MAEMRLSTIQYTTTRKREAIWVELFSKDKKVLCFVCGKPVSRKEASLEHKTPLSKGGTWTINNLSISHKRCNNGRNS